MIFKTRHLRTLFCYLLLLGLAGSFTACNTDDEEETILGDWDKRSDFAGVARSGAVSFTIGDVAFVGTGYDGKNRLNDFWQYDPTRDSWTRKAAFPGAARSAAVSFVANGKGYVGMGYDGINYMKDFWEYDPTTDSWKQVADFPASARYGAVALSINDKGYVGAGYDGNYQKDFWEYDPAYNQWTEKVGLGGAKRMNAYTFVYNGKGYIGGGTNNGLYETDFLEYDPTTDSWRRLKSFTTTERDGEYYPTSRVNAVTFIINGKGYLCTGSTGSVQSEVWEYDFATDIWKQKTSFEGSAREAAVGFAFGNHGYLTTGNNSGYRFDDLWLFDPTLEQE